MVIAPAYTLELPSLEDNTTLSARIYHPSSLQGDIQKTSTRPSAKLQGAIVAHPYAPLGGSYDDHVVLAVTETLLGCGFVVVTFNFRGSGESQGRTSWTGQGELDDYASIVGCLIHYLQNLSITQEDVMTLPDPTLFGASSTTMDKSIFIDLVLAGYSYGSLILARLPPPSTIANRFDSALIGSPAAEIILRARTLAKRTKQSVLKTLQRSHEARGRISHANATSSTATPSGRTRAATVTIGGEETDPAHRLRSDSGRSSDFVRKSIEAPYRIVAHVRGHSGSRDHARTASESAVPAARVISEPSTAPEIHVRYLLISPVVLPFTNLLLPPGPPVPSMNFRQAAVGGRAGAQFLRQPTLAIFGTADAFTNDRRLSSWAEKQATESEKGDFRWEKVEGAGHFWREQEELRALHETIDRWVHNSIS